jgi:hypothetical protein
MLPRTHVHTPCEGRATERIYFWGVGESGFALSGLPRWEGAAAAVAMLVLTEGRVHYYENQGTAVNKIADNHHQGQHKTAIHGESANPKVV